jgi:hypothetical protein
MLANTLLRFTPYLYRCEYHRWPFCSVNWTFGAQPGFFDSSTLKSGRPDRRDDHVMLAASALTS